MDDNFSPQPLADDGDEWLDTQLKALRLYTPQPGFESRVLWQVDGWVDRRLGNLPSFSPSNDLESRVMAQIESLRVPAAASVRAVAVPVIPRAVAVRSPIRRRLAIGSGLVAAMGASAWWSGGHQATVAVMTSWLTFDVPMLVSAVARSAIDQLGSIQLIDEARRSMATPNRLAFAGAGLALLYTTSVVALRRLMALPSSGAQHAA